MKRQQQPLGAAMPQRHSLDKNKANLNLRKLSGDSDKKAVDCNFVTHEQMRRMVMTDQCGKCVSVHLSEGKLDEFGAFLEFPIVLSLDVVLSFIFPVDVASSPYKVGHNENFFKRTVF